MAWRGVAWCGMVWCGVCGEEGLSLAGILTRDRLGWVETCRRGVRCEGPG